MSRSTDTRLAVHLKGAGVRGPHTGAEVRGCGGADIRARTVGPSRPRVVALPHFRTSAPPHLSRRSFLQIAGAALGGALIPAHSAAQTASRITTTDLGDATLLQGAGCNVVAIAGPDGA